MKNINHVYLKNLIISYLLAATPSMTVFYIGTNKHILPNIQNLVSNTNIFFYCLSLLIFCATFLFTFYNLQKNKINSLGHEQKITPLLSNIISCGIAFTFFAIFLIMVLNSSDTIGYFTLINLSKAKIMLIILIFCCLAFIFKKIIFRQKIFKNRIFWIIAAIFACLIVAYCFYTPNSLIYSYDYNAYYHSIFIHLNGTPFSENFLSIYGHYAILFRPIFAVIGLNIYTIALTSAGIAFISIAGIIYAIFKITKQTSLRILGIILTIFPFVGFGSSCYPQAYPHRLLFPSMFIVLASYMLNSFGKKQKILLFTGYVLSVLAIIWNGDTGLMCLLAWTVFHVYLLAINNPISIKALIKIIYPFIFVPICFLCAWGMTSLYNIAIGGSAISLYYFLFPMLENNYMYGVLHLDLPLYLSYWMIIFLIFLVFIGFGISRFYVVGKKRFNKKIAFCFFIAILGISQFTYFMNRCAHFNITLGYFEAAILLIVIADLTISSIFAKNLTLINALKRGIFYVCITICIACTVTLCLGFRQKIANTNNAQNVSLLKELAEQYSDNVEVNIPLIASYGTSLDIYLNLKNQIRAIDLTDSFLQSHREYIIHSIISTGKPFVIEERYIDILQNTECKIYISDCDKFSNLEELYNISEVGGGKINWPRYNVQKLVILHSH